MVFGKSLFEDIPPLSAYCTQYQYNYANDAEELERLNRSLESLPRPAGTQKGHETLHKERVIAVREEPSLHVEVTPARCHKCETQW